MGIMKLFARKLNEEKQPRLFRHNLYVLLIMELSSHEKDILFSNTQTK